MFNYRGCGGSKGTPRTADDLVADGAAVLEAVSAYVKLRADRDWYLVGKLNAEPHMRPQPSHACCSYSGLPSSKILLYGISLGGACVQRLTQN